MNMEILFRGKRCSDGKWVYGFYVESKQSWQGHNPHKSWIVPNAISNGGFFNILGRYAVKDDTVGQFTGMTDKHGVKIFEGDMVKHPYIDPIFGDLVETENGVTSQVVFHDGSFVIKYDIDRLIYLDEFTRRNCVEVIGNMYDNPELLSTK